MLFEDLALPNLKQNQQRQLTEYKTHRAGYTANGVPANISVVRSLQNSLARRTAMTAGKRRELHALEENLAIISNSEPAQLLEEERLRKEIAELRAKIERVPFIDTFDLRYKNYEKRPDPSSQAVMFCLMDVSVQWINPLKIWLSVFIFCCICSSAERIRTWKSYTSAIIPRRKKSMNMSFLLAGNRRHHCFQRPETDG